jgi:hypothetical protein
MRNWDSSDEHGKNNCPITQDYVDMKEVCQSLQIPSHEVRNPLYFFSLTIGLLCPRILDRCLYSIHQHL